jgi:hypothetical protein
VTEIEAMGREIARLVSNELTASGEQAVADLNTILEQSAER